MSKTDNHTAIVCTLNDAEFRERRILARQTILPKIIRYHRIKNGLVLAFENTENTLMDVRNFILLEQECCGFLTFDLNAEKTSQEKPFKLAITGPHGAAAFTDIFVEFIETESHAQITI